MEKVDKNGFIIYETACNIWIWEHLVAHCIRVKSQYGIYVNLLIFNLMRSSCFFPKEPHVKTPIVIEHCSIIFSVGTLFNVLEFDALALVLLFECELICF
jgi:hypothetical protein